MIKFVYVAIMLGNFYENSLKIKFLQRQYEMISFTSQNNRIDNSTKSRWKDFGIYTLEFIASSPLPALEALLYLVSESFAGYTEPPSPAEAFGAGILLASINSVIISVTCDLIGRATRKKGNLLNSAIGSFIGSSITCSMIGYSACRGYELPPDLITFFAISIGTLPQLGGVIGYNLK